MRIALLALVACTGTSSPVLTSTSGPGTSGTLHPDAIGIAVGGPMACALNHDGTMACWGDNEYNQTVALDGSFTQITLAASYACGLHGDGTVACSRDDELSPAGGFAQISAGSANSTCGLRFDGTSTCWFHDWWQKVMPPSETFVAISNGGAFGCGLHSDGTAMCWGGETQPPPPPTGSFVAIDARGLCALDATGQLSCWAIDAPDTKPPPARFRAVDEECGVEEDGTLVCWGYLVSRHPELAQPLPGHFKAVALEQFFDNIHANDFNLCALREDGAVQCIGSEVPEAGP